jgi:hypothetical protein
MIRVLTAALLAMLLATRLLSPVGFMPAFDHGAVTIVACPDYQQTSPASPHHHGKGKASDSHQHCPYAAGSGLGAIPVFVVLAVLAVVYAAIAQNARPDRFVEHRRSGERPPLRGPPLTV